MACADVLHPKQLASVEEQEFDNIRRMVIHYARTQYSYTITDEDVHEILYSGYWSDIDDFCSYMQQVNFGRALPGSTNVELPSTVTIYSDDELDDMDTRLCGTQTPMFLGLYNPDPFEFEDEVESDDELDYEDEYEVADEQPSRDTESPEANDDTLPLYSQVCADEDEVLLVDDPPCYDAEDFAQQPPVYATKHTELATDDKYLPAGQENLVEVGPEHDNEPEPDEARSHRVRLGRKLLEVRQKFSRGVKAVHPRGLIKGMSRIRGKIRRTDRSER
jgi:hypothetical protein